MAYVNYKNSPSEETPLTGGATGNLNVMQENGTSHGSDTKLGYSQAFLNDHLVNVSNEVDEDYRVNLLKGKNLFDKNNFIKLDGIYISISNGAIGSYQGNKTLVIQCNPSTTYTIQKISGATFRVGSYATYPSVGTNALTYQINSTGTTITITTGSTAKYLCVQYFGTDDTQTESTILNSIQIEYGSTATTYEPYITPSIYVDNEEIYNKDNLEQYSTSEIRIGTWIDGKPLYRKVIVLGSLPNVSIETNTYYNHNISNLNMVTNISGVAYTSNGKYSLAIPFREKNDKYISLYVNDTVVTIISNKDYSSYTGYVILEYTKTTDA